MIQVTDKYFINPTQRCFVVYAKSANPKYADISLKQLTGMTSEIEDDGVEEDIEEGAEKIRKDRILLHPTYHGTMEQALMEVVKRLELDALKGQSLSIEEAIKKIQDVHRMMYEHLAISLSFEFPAEIDLGKEQSG